MLQHHQYVVLDFGSNFRPHRTRTESKGLQGFVFEMQPKYRHGFHVGVQHGLQHVQHKLCSRLEKQLPTSVSCPVKYPSFMLHPMHASWSPDIAASSRQNHLSINSLEYSLLAPKSTSSTCRQNITLSTSMLVEMG